MAGHRVDDSMPLAWTVDALFDSAECEALVARCDAMPREIATVGYASGARSDLGVRDNERARFVDDALRELLWQRAAQHVPTTWDGDEACGVSADLRFYSYRSGQRFAPHRDGVVTLPGGARSRLTYLVYLDEGCEGGETVFPRIATRVTPCAGTALFFQHALLHEALPVTRGTKRVLRTDVLYRPSPDAVPTQGSRSEGAKGDDR